MHAILITFHSDVPVDELMTDPTPMMEALSATEGLISKTFITEDAHNAGGFYLFTTRVAAETYLEGAFFTGFRGHPALSNVQVRHFQVETEPSQALGTPTTALIVAA